ncbi:YciI family protein [Nonomuraea sp. NPDC004580]|uniref:YciI family protein n=1 Tax=Nonomuraea sp. NPDC004580 TaxID=3154552 RepID=UPI0033AE9B89
MKFLLIMHVNPQVWDGLTDEQRNAVMNGHGTFMETIRKSGEFIETAALGDVSESAVVRVRGGAPVVTDGPYLEAKEYFGGYYLVECDSRERALELAALIPDASVEGLGIEVRPVVFSSAGEG